MTVRILTGHVLDKLAELPDESCHMCVTSPPYYGLRAYGTEPQVWGGEDCEHEWGAETIKAATNKNVGMGERQAAKGQRWSATNSVEPETNRAMSQGQTCLRCGAWRGELGQEPTVDLYVAHLVAVFAAVKRVLRRDGVLFVNLGDSYNNRTKVRVSSHQPALNGYVDAEWKDVAAKGGVRMSTTDGGLKEKDLFLVPDRFRLAMQADGWWVRSKMPWVKRNCLSGGTRVYVRSQKGDMPMTIKDMVRLDPATVQLWNGERWTQAVDWWETPRPDDAIEIELRTGERIGCTKDHRWPTRRGLVEARDLVAGDVIDWTPLPEPDQPRRPKMLTGDIGWFVGLSIAEGHRSGGAITITGHKDESDRWGILRHIADDYDATMTMWLSESGNVARAHIHSTILDGVIDAYVSGDRACGKHLDVRCWRRNDEFLAAVLEGYLGGDGHWDEQNRRWRIGFCENDALAADLRTLCARLDFGLRLKRCEHRFNGVPFPGWRGTVRTERPEPSAIPGTFKPTDDTEIVAIGKSRARKFWDIEVADEPHLFALASGVLTHNCMPESTQDRPTTAVEDVMLFTRSPRYFWDAEAVKRGYSRDWNERNAGPNNWVNDPTMRTMKLRSGDTEGGGHYGLTDTLPGTGRNFRTSDFFYDSLGLILDESGDDEPETDGEHGEPRGYFAGVHASTPHIRHGRDSRNAIHFPDGVQLSERANAGPDFEPLGLILDESGDPIALDVNPEPFKGAHFAVFPSKLVRPLILASTSEKGCCAECGAPWTRVVEKSTRYHDPAYRKIEPQPKMANGGGVRNDYGTANTGLAKPGWRNYDDPSSQTTGWSPSCSCDAAVVPCTVLDCFGGSGTTGLVADQLGRDAILIDLQPDYVGMGADRITGDAPLFAAVEITR